MVYGGIPAADFSSLKINVREYRRGNQKWTIQRTWQHRVHKTKTNKTERGEMLFVFSLQVL
jgi:hypothetical protein